MAAIRGLQKLGSPPEYGGAAALSGRRRWPTGPERVTNRPFPGRPLKRYRLDTLGIGYWLMLIAWDSLFCQMFHSSFAVVVSYSRQGAYRCSKTGCRAQRTHDAHLAVAAT